MRVSGWIQAFFSQALFCGMSLAASVAAVLTTRAAGTEARLEVASHRTLMVTHDGLALPVSLECPRLVFEGETIGGTAPSGMKGDIESEGPVEIVYEPLPLKGGAVVNVQLFVQWSSAKGILHKWAAVRLGPGSPTRLLKEVILEDISIKAEGPALIPHQATLSAPMSYPVFFGGFYAGIEYPIATTRLAAGHAILAHAPGLRLHAEHSYQTRKAVYGIASPGKEVRAFQDYIAENSPGARGRMFAWEPWVSVPIRYLEQDHLDLLAMIDERLYRRHGTAIDACVMTAGWSDPQSLWQIDKARFPDGFARARQASERMKCRMGLWISPSSCYPFALDGEWAKRQGYETIGPPAHPFRVLCLGGTRYQAEFKKRLLDLFTRYDIAYAYFDGYLFQCPEKNHGHEPDGLSAEAIAEGFLDAVQSLRRIKPDVWLEATAFGGNASPWWLFHVNTVLGNYGDDYPWGRTAAPVYRESYITARDYSNLQGRIHGLLPAVLQEVFAGLYNHTREPVVNDAVMGSLRGSSVYLLCTNPKVMDDYGWAALARVIEWTRTNSAILNRTQALLPASWTGGRCPRFSNDAPAPREPYGYAHWGGYRGIVAVRNPWISPQAYALKLDGETSLSPQARGLSAVSLYPENRVYAKQLAFGDTLTIPLAPYETVVLAVGPGLTLAGIPESRERIGKRIRATGVRGEVRRVEFLDTKRPDSASKSTQPAGFFGPDWTATIGRAKRSLELRLEAVVSLASTQGELLVLSEEKSQPIPPQCRLLCNGKEVRATMSGPDLGYSGTVVPRPEQWLFARFPLVAGENDIRLELVTRSESPKVSVWAWATRPGAVDGSKYPNSLPQPEIMSLDAVQIVAPVTLEDRGLAAESRQPPVERIQGVFLDSLKPTAVSGGVVKNANPAGSPLTVRGREPLRGLGVVAPARVSFALGGKYRRFECLVGVDAGTPLFDKSILVFEVWVDGQKRWESAKMNRWDEPVWLDLSVEAATKLELVVSEKGRPGLLDRTSWGAWADARLLK